MERCSFQHQYCCCNMHQLRQLFSYPSWILLPYYFEITNIGTEMITIGAPYTNLGRGTFGETVIHLFHSKINPKDFLIALPLPLEMDEEG